MEYNRILVDKYITFLLNDPFSIDLIDETMLNDPQIIEICKQILISNGIHYKTTKKIES